MRSSPSISLWGSATQTPIGVSLGDDDCGCDCEDVTSRLGVLLCLGTRNISQVTRRCRVGETISEKRLIEVSQVPGCVKLFKQDLVRTYAPGWFRPGRSSVDSPVWPFVARLSLSPTVETTACCVQEMVSVGSGIRKWALEQRNHGESKVSIQAPNHPLHGKERTSFKVDQKMTPCTIAALFVEPKSPHIRSKLTKGAKALRRKHLNSSPPPFSSSSSSSSSFYPSSPSSYDSKLTPLNSLHSRSPLDTCGIPWHSMTFHSISDHPHCYLRSLL